MNIDVDGRHKITCDVQSIFRKTDDIFIERQSACYEKVFKYLKIISKVFKFETRTQFQGSAQTPNRLYTT